jgi:hypothetical protein
MCPYEVTDFDEEGSETLSEREPGARPERLNRPKASRRVKIRATRRSRANTGEMAKRGMHQRRSKRMSW